MAWTNAQLDAIETRNKTVLVSAAAGSGKTTTLTERIIRRLTDESSPDDISRYLIVTFTKASATDLKNKISKALGEALAKHPASKHLNRQMIQLGGAKICTIDSFYSSVVRSNFQLLGLPAALSVIDGGDRQVLMIELMERVLDHRYNSKNDEADFTDFMDAFMDMRGSDTAVGELISLYEKLNGVPEFLDFLLLQADSLDASAEKSFLETEYGKIILEKAEIFLEHSEKALSDFIETISCDDKAVRAYGPSFSYDKEHFSFTLDAVRSGDYISAAKAFSSYSPIRCGSYRGDDLSVKEGKEQRDELVKAYRLLGRTYFSYENEEITFLMRRTAAFCRSLFSVLAEFEEKFKAAKTARGLCDFNDNKRGALELFLTKDGKPTPLAKEYSARFDAIYIDEYQDTDAVQDMIFSAISRSDNRFMVGDIKQSIYRFRGTDPEVFLSYKNRFPEENSDSEDTTEKSIFMSENFRCDRTVTDFVNAVCDYIFTVGKNSTGYTERDALVCGKTVLPEGRELSKTQFTIIRANRRSAAAEEDGLDCTPGGELEIRYVVSEIKRLLTSPDALCEENGQLRRLRPGDIAVLARSNSVANSFASALKKCGIATTSREEKNYFENPEVLLALCLLCTIDNPQKDVYLAGLLRSPLYGFNMDELAEIRLCGGKGETLFDCVVRAFESTENTVLREKLSYFLEKLGKYRECAISMPVDKLLRFLYADTSLMSFAGLSYEEGKNEKSDFSVETGRANLLLLYDYARRFERGGFKGLYNFIGYIKELIDAGQTFDAPTTEGNSDVVNVMSIHHSKGLEFPVVFLVSAHKKFYSGSDSVMRFDKSLGIGVNLRDSTGFASLRNILLQTLDEKSLREDAEEEKRVLYVALTRARERLYVSGYTYSADFERKAEARRRYPDRYSIDSCQSYLDWLLMALPENTAVCNYRVLSPEMIPELTRIDYSEKRDILEDNDKANEIYDEIKNRFSFVYPYTYLSTIPAKLSVSRLYPDVLDSEEDNAANSDEALPPLTDVPRFLNDSENEFSAAQRGTATHAFLQFCDLEKSEKNGVSAELERLTLHGFIDDKTAKIVNVKQLEVFFESKLYQSLKSARRIYREQRFNICLPASAFTQNDELKMQIEGETLVVQGVIDLVFEDANGELILCDYKTDYLTSDECSEPSLAREKLSKRHKMQLSYYTAAVEKIFGKAPSKTLIYSLPLGDTVEIEIDKIGE